MRLLLASRSPQRRAILERLGVAFEVVVPEGVEELEHGEPAAVAIENARRKARAVAPEGAAATTLGVDTVVVLDGRIHGKPPSERAARTVLEALSGREHVVISGVCAIDGDGERCAVERTAVRFRALSASELSWYVASGEWRERAGGYAIQGRGMALVAAIEGDHSNVVGLPVPLLLDLVPGLLG